MPCPSPSTARGRTLDWGERYRRGETPWDLGAPHPELVAALRRDGLGRRRLGHGVRVFVPGCGRGHDALALARSGWVVTAMDLAAEVEPFVGPQLEVLGGHFVAGDALEYVARPPFEALWEHTFFCALPLEDRPRYGEMARRLLAVRGRLHALVFPADRPLEEGGPPWRTTVQDLQEALGGAFRLVADRPVEHPAPGRPWAERWAVFERLDTDPGEDGDQDL